MISDLDIICNNLLQRSEIELEFTVIGGSEIELELQLSEDRS